MSGDLLEKEGARVAALQSYEIIGTPPESAYDEIAELAAHVCGCPAALVNFVDDRSIWTKSRYGVPPHSGPLPRELFMCSHAALGADLLIVPDASRDERFAHMPVVANAPHVKFYCGMPLINPEGYSVGSLCVVDFQPHDAISFEQQEALRRLSRQVIAQLELRRSVMALEEARQRVETEREKSERLLRSMLPPSIAAELKERNQVTPRFYDAATILFADFEGFTKLAERLEPKTLIDQLNEFFSTVDEIAERHGLEMLKTIGDAYMCVGGLPEVNRTHAVDACLAAVEMQAAMAQANRQREKLRLPRWELRIGLHTGPVIAGVIGRRKFIYDVWGDAVNVGARMEAAGAGGRINVSEAVYQRVKDRFEFEPRGSVEVKNKGLLNMFFLVGAKPSAERR
jgi:class 3 adenylate cyclase